jgi:hypothetical protein
VYERSRIWSPRQANSPRPSARRRPLKRSPDVSGRGCSKGGVRFSGHRADGHTGEGFIPDAAQRHPVTRSLPAAHIRHPTMDERRARNAYERNLQRFARLPDARPPERRAGTSSRSSGPRCIAGRAGATLSLACPVPVRSLRGRFAHADVRCPAALNISDRTGRRAARAAGDPRGRAKCTCNY